jgi:hypothetical protein
MENLSVGREHSTATVAAVRRYEELKAEQDAATEIGSAWRMRRRCSVTPASLTF